MKNASIWKHIGSICFFIIVTIIFFLPQFQGKELIQGDVSKWEGMVHETVTYHEETGNNVSWCGSMFSGMPGYTIGIGHSIPDAINMLYQPLYALGSNTAAIMLLTLICSYIFFVSLRCSTPISILGALAFAFSSYFPIIIAAGHVTKAFVMATMPLVLAGLILVLKRKWLPGCLLFTFGLTVNLRHNHIQITYYLFILCLFLYAGYLFYKIKEKKWKEIGSSASYLLVGVVVAILLNSANLYSNYEMSKTSTRGKSELSSAVDGKQDKSSGLDQDYAFAWSYGIKETLTLLIPNIYGGESGGTLDKESNLAKAFKKNGYQTPKPLQTYTYWGDQPFTSGPVYFGAIICFLFVLSLFIVDNKYRWWVVAASAFLIIMSWGRNFGIINDFLFHYMPFYNKFRTPSMALVIPQFTFVWLACMALKVIYEKRVELAKLERALLISGGITAGITLLFALFPTLFLNFTGQADAGAQFPNWYFSALIEDRKELLTSDAWRSFFFIAAAFALLYLPIKLNKKEWINGCIIAITLLCFFDLWSIDKRYLNEDNFARKSKVNEFAQTNADKFILQDNDPSYRVLTLNNPFNDSNVSYHHKSIGGYNAAKLRRYQDLIDIYIEKEISLLGAKLSSGISNLNEADSVVSYTATPVLDMLNMRYLIINPNIPAATNLQANGNAWFVKNIVFAENADEEMLSLSNINLKSEAVVDKSFANIISEGNIEEDNNAKIEMTSYEPIAVKYHSETTKENIAIFSEIYYQPGWNAYIDGEKVEHFRANWILRGLKIPAGNHEIEFKYEPDTYWFLKYASAVGSVILVLLIVGYVVFSMYKRNKKE